jgi:hypothetical protein
MVNWLSHHTLLRYYLGPCFPYPDNCYEINSPTSRSVKCVEINKQSKMSFENSTSRLPRNLGCTITWHNTDASVVCNQFIFLHWLYILYSSNSLEPASWHQEPVHWLAGSSVVVVDPPRKGLHPTVISALQRVALSERKAFKARRYGYVVLTVYVYSIQ